MKFRIQITVLLTIAFVTMLQSQVAKRVVALAPSVTKSLYQMGAQDKLVGCTSYCITKKEDNIQVVGSAVKVNVEKLYALKPDLVITAGLTTPETIDMLKKLKIKYKVFESPADFNGICNQFMEIAKLVGADKEATRIIQEEKAKLTKLKSKVPNGKKPRIFIELGAKPLFAVIPNTFMHDYINYVGGENIATDMSTGIISRETILLKNPDYIFITTMGETDKAEADSWLKYNKLNAAINKKIFTLQSDMACTPTPASFTKTVATMIKMMYE